VTTTTEPFADVPPPAGAARTCEWDNTETPAPSRYWMGTRRRASDAEIILDGTQYSHGPVERCLTVRGVDCDESMPTDTARKIGAALMRAAKELDGLK
jgi:hypothetical protein